MPGGNSEVEGCEMLTYRGTPIPTWRIWATVALVLVLVGLLIAID